MVVKQNIYQFDNSCTWIMIFLSKKLLLNNCCWDIDNCGIIVGQVVGNKINCIMIHDAVFPCPVNCEERKSLLHSLSKRAGHKIPIIYISHKQYRTNPCVLVALYCAAPTMRGSHNERLTFPEIMSLKVLMKEHLSAVCAAHSCNEKLVSHSNELVT